MKMLNNVIMSLMRASTRQAFKTEAQGSVDVSNMEDVNFVLLFILHVILLCLTCAWCLHHVINCRSYCPPQYTLMRNTINTQKCTQMFPSNLHWALAGAGRGGGRGSSGSLGKQGLASKLVGTVLSSWAGLLNSHLCCSCCRSLLIWTERQKDFLYSHHFANAQSCSVEI